MNQKPRSRIAIAGDIGHVEHVLNGVAARAHAAIVAVAPGPSEAGADSLARRCIDAGHQPDVFRDHSELLAKSQPEILAVTCHFGDHARITEAALKQGVHVFSEKPVATTLFGLQAIEQAYRNSGAQLSCMFDSRYDPAFAAAYSAVRDGRIGDIQIISCQKSYKLGQRSPFYGDRSLYGGTIPWVGSHAIDWILWFGGGRYSSVYACHTAREVPHVGRFELAAQCQFQLTNGILANVSIDYFRPPAAVGHGDDRIRVVGSTGTVEVRHGAAVVEQNGEARTLALEPRREIFAEFIDQVTGQGVCSVSAEDAFAATRASLLARQSADEGRVVCFDGTT